MTGPSWVYIYYGLLPSQNTLTPWDHGENVTEAEINFRKAAYRSYKQVLSFLASFDLFFKPRAPPERRLAKAAYLSHHALMVVVVIGATDKI